MNRITEIAERLNSLAERLDPYDYEGTATDHLEILKADPLDIVEQLLDIIDDLK